METITAPPMLDETGRKIVNALNRVKDALRESLNGEIFGFIEHLDALDPTTRITYTDANENYTPISVDKTNGTYSLNDWNGFPWLVDNKPWMVHADGTPDYRLKEDDYTKKLDGTESDVADTSYEGGAFSWADKIYKYERTVGNERIVKFSFVSMPGFEPTGFVDKNGNVLEGRWIPMFYGSVVNGAATSISGTQPSYSLTTEQQKAAIDGLGAQANFLGGPFVETLIDLMILFSKTTELQGHYGTGNMSGYVNDSSQYYGVKANAVVGGGQFYGTSTGTALNKIFHSVVLGSYQQWMRDPYEVVINGRVKVSKNYIYDLTGATYTDTGITVPNSASGGWRYPTVYISVDEYGSLPDITSASGSTSTGVCDGTYTRGSDQSSAFVVALRFGYCGFSSLDGPRARDWSTPGAHANGGLGFAALLDPPVGVVA